MGSTGIIVDLAGLVDLMDVIGMMGGFDWYHS